MRLLLIDGHYYAYRSFFAIQNLTNSRGEPTNAIYGFVKAVRRMLIDLKPDRAALIMDGGLPKDRMDLLPTYKANRAEMPDTMRVQMPIIESIAELIGLPKIVVDEHEADDVMACYAAAAKLHTDCEIIFATNDKDLMQVVDNRLKIYSPGKEGFELIDALGVEKKWGVPPEKIGDILTLTGDTSDNIPGVPGIGPKTAAKLIIQFGSVDELMRRLPEVASDKLRAALESSREIVVRNKKMVSLNCRIPLPMPWEQLKISPKYPELIAECKRLEFKSLTAEIEKESGTMTKTFIGQGELGF
ncbi:MAG: 5'-3' exonuclease H3TH domain-containing protein [Verrucomicrobiota bacterium]|nr:5'-3' exonuclease H3TH domain-containing protein [Verrucomicrobiota bacterium]